MVSRNRGCQTCKSRKIKCDAAKPVCRQCVKSKRICVPPSTSTKRQVTFSVHDENRFASGQVKRPRGPRSSYVAHQPILPPISSSSSSRPSLPSLLQDESDLSATAVTYYTKYFLQIIPGAPLSLAGVSECVTAWVESGRQDEMVDFALSSISLAVYANTRHFRPKWRRDVVDNKSYRGSDSSAIDIDVDIGVDAGVVRAQLEAEAEAASKLASSHYHRLLQVVQKRIASVELSSFGEDDVDACLLTIFLMGRYEGVIYGSRHGKSVATASTTITTTTKPIITNNNSKNIDITDNDNLQSIQRWSHHEGVLAILKVWVDRFSVTRNHTHPTVTPASEIVKQSRRGQLRSAILRGRVLPDWLQDGSVFGEGQNAADLKYDNVVIRLVKLKLEVNRLWQKLAEEMAKGEARQKRMGGEMERMTFEGLENEAKDIERALEEWFEPFKRACPRTQHVLPASSSSSSSSSPSSQSATSLNYQYPRPHFYHNRISSYLNHGHAGLWNQYLGCRILVLCTRSRIMDLYPSFQDLRRRLLQHRSHLNSTTDVNNDGTSTLDGTLKELNEAALDLAMNIPSCLELVTSSSTTTITQQEEEEGEQPGADSPVILLGTQDEDILPSLTGTLIWPLTIACGVLEIDPQLKIWLRGELSSIGYICGDGVLRCASTDEWNIEI